MGPGECHPDDQHMEEAESKIQLEGVWGPMRKKRGDRMAPDREEMKEPFLTA